MAQWALRAACLFCVCVCVWVCGWGGGWGVGESGRLAGLPNSEGRLLHWHLPSWLLS
jgi:hypothetical protein